MPVLDTTVNDLDDLYNTLLDYLTGCGVLGATGYTGTGNGSITGLKALPGTVTETWTLTCTTAAANGGTFSVVGSVSGAQADATVGNAYDNGFIQFTLADGAADFVVSDAFTIPVTQGDLSAINQAWVDLGTSGGESWRYLKGVGLAGTDEIIIALASERNTNDDWYALTLRGMDAFMPGQAIDNQPNVSPQVYMHAWNGAMPINLVANGRRFWLDVQVSTTEQCCGAGFLLTTDSPQRLPYPLFISGNTNSPSLRWSSESWNDGNPWDPGASTAWFRHSAGIWSQVSNHIDHNGGRKPVGTTFIFPWTGSGVIAASLIRDMPDGSHLLLPAIVSSAEHGGNTYGALDGIFFISGFNNGSGNTLDIDGKTYRVMQNMGHTYSSDYAALLME